jgi:hypothetical protein
MKGDLSKLATLRANLRALPRTLAADVARRAAPELTNMAQGSFDSGESVYGDARPAGADGGALTLRRTGAAESVIRFVAIGTIVRTPVFPRYFKYLIAKYGVLPGGNAAIPTAWTERLNGIVKESKPVL